MPGVSPRHAGLSVPDQRCHFGRHIKSQEDIDKHPPVSSLTGRSHKIFETDFLTAANSALLNSPKR